MLRTMRDPIVVLQATDALPHSVPKELNGYRWKQLGPGVFGMNIPDEWEMYVHVAERYRPSPSILYSENLIMQPGLDIQAPSDYATYYRTMVPLRLEGSQHPLLCTTLGQLVHVHEMMPKKEIYFAPIGKRFKGVWEWPTSWEAVHHMLPLRTVMAIALEDLHKVAFVKEHFVSYEYKRMLYFYVSIDPQSKISMSIQTAEGSTRASVSIKEYLPYHAKWAIHGDKLLVYSERYTHSYCVCHFKTIADVYYVASLWLDSPGSGSTDIQFLSDLAYFVNQRVEMRDWNPEVVQNMSRITLHQKMKGHTIVALGGMTDALRWRHNVCTGCVVCMPLNRRRSEISCCGHPTRLDVVHRSKAYSADYADFGKESVRTTEEAEPTEQGWDALVQGLTKFQWLPHDEKEDMSRKLGAFDEWSDPREKERMDDQHARQDHHWKVTT